MILDFLFALFLTTFLEDCHWRKQDEKETLLASGGIDG